MCSPCPGPASTPDSWYSLFSQPNDKGEFILLSPTAPLRCVPILQHMIPTHVVVFESWTMHVPCCVLTVCHCDPMDFGFKSLFQIWLLWLQWFQYFFPPDYLLGSWQLHPRRCKTIWVGQSAQLSIPRSTVRFQQKLKKSRTQIYMDLRYIDPQARVLNYCFKS